MNQSIRCYQMIRQGRFPMVHMSQYANIPNFRLYINHNSIYVILFVQNDDLMVHCAVLHRYTVPACHMSWNITYRLSLESHNRLCSDLHIYTFDFKEFNSRTRLYPDQNQSQHRHTMSLFRTLKQNAHSLNTGYICLQKPYYIYI